jgi:hypothetical protein
MRRLLFTTAAVALLLAPAAASAKTGWESDRDWESLVPGERTNVTITGVFHGDGPRGDLQGVAPTVVFTELTTGREYRFEGSKADANGRSVVPVTVPNAGGYQVEVFVGDRIEGGWPPIHITAAAGPAAPAPGPGDRNPSDALYLGSALLALAALAIAATRLRRPRLGGAG